MRKINKKKDGLFYLRKRKIGKLQLLLVQDYYALGILRLFNLSLCHILIMKANILKQVLVQVLEFVVLVSMIKMIWLLVCFQIVLNNQKIQLLNNAQYQVQEWPMQVEIELNYNKYLLYLLLIQIVHQNKVHLLHFHQG